MHLSANPCNPTTLFRDVGISKATFQQLLDKVATYWQLREKNPMKKRGLQQLASQTSYTHLDLPQTLSYLCQVGQGIFNQ